MIGFVVPFTFLPRNYLHQVMIIFRQPRQLVEADDVFCQKRDQSCPHQITDWPLQLSRNKMDRFPLIVKIIYFHHLNVPNKSDYFRLQMQ